MLGTLGEIRDRVRTVLGVGSSLVTDTTLESYIDQAYRTQLPQDLVPPELENHFSLSVVSGTSEYGLDSDILAIRGPTWIETDSIQVFYDDAYFFSFAKDRYTQEYRKPNCALLFANQLWLYPVPDDSYKLSTTALARPDKLDTDTDTVFLPAWATPVVYGAAAFYAYDQGDYEASTSHYRMYADQINQARNNQLLRYTHHRADPKY